MRRGVFLAAFLATTGLIVGCDSGIKQFPVAAVTGVVTCNGQPVAKAQVYFEPLQEGKDATVGKSAFSFTDEQGRFTLSTYGNLDGAVVGKHRVRVGGDGVDCECDTNSERDVMQVEVKEGTENEFTLVLPPKPKTPPRLVPQDPDAEDSAMDLQ